MSQENIAVVRRAHDAGLRLDVDAFIECCRPDVEWEENTSVYLGLRPFYRGHEGVREWFSEALLEPWSDMQVERLDFLNADDDHVVVDFTFAARGKTSGIETRLRIWEVYWLVEGKITRRQLFSTEADALKAVGLAE
jgi:ketosteroid isomerase-like protein